ncbi:MAG: alpha/beta fold hydrolase [Bdellovibrionota bacterium]
MSKYLFLVAVLAISFFESTSVFASEIHYRHAKHHQVKTEDGIGLHVLELLDKNDQPMTEGEPMLLVHGYTSNWNSFRNVAEIYRKKGHRVFLANWRGHGQPPFQSLEIASPESDKKMLFENLPTFDVPALIQFVSRESGGRKIIYQGHSMGGMMAHLAFAGLTKDASGKLVIDIQRAKRLEKLVKAFIPIASPLSLNTREILGGFLLEPLTSLFNLKNDHSDTISHHIPFGLLHKNLRLTANYISLRQLGTLHGLINLENISPQEFIDVYYLDGSNVPDTLNRQMRALRLNGYVSEDGEISYVALSQWLESKILYYKSRIPTLLVSAEDDSLALLREQKELAKKRKLKQVLLEGVGHIDILASAEIAKKVATSTLRFVKDAACEAALE